MVQFAAQIGQCLRVGRFGPQRTGNALTRDGRVAGVKKEKGDELLLARTWWPRRGAAIDENTEAPEQLNPQNGWKSHATSLLRTECHQRIDARRLLCGKIARCDAD